MEAITEKYIKIRNVIDSSYIENAMTYSEYRRLIDAMIIVGKSTAKQESQNLLEYSKLNVVRMNRLDKTAQLIPELEDAVLDIHTTQTWLVLTEGWCGDAAQIIPVLNKIADLNPLITLRLLLRDENPGLMDQYLTRGKSRSIPRLIVLNEHHEELFNFGPRPMVLQEMFYHMKANAMNNEAVKEEIHSWYAYDKTITTQQELLQLLKTKA